VKEIIMTKKEKLTEIIKGYGSMVVAFSGGVDSTFLLAFASEVLGDKVLGVTALSSTYAARERQAAVNFCKERKIAHLIIESEELDIPEFSKNPSNRCYYCKHELFGKLSKVAKEREFKVVADGSNADDLNDFRPGMQAAKELNVVSPLREAELTKDEIRQLSKEMRLSTWDKPAAACLASRFPYGTEITKSKLRMVEQCENYLYENGIRTFRVRHHGDIVRVEIGKDELEKVFGKQFREAMVSAFKKIGYAYITLDLEGYRTGSMNEVLSEREKTVNAE
jgi:uncharacterized protein